MRERTGVEPLDDMFAVQSVIQFMDPSNPDSPYIPPYVLHTACCLLQPRVCNFTALFTLQFVFAAAAARHTLHCVYAAFAVAAHFAPDICALPLLWSCIRTLCKCSQIFWMAPKRLPLFPIRECEPHLSLVLCSENCTYMHVCLQQRNQFKCQGLLLVSAKELLFAVCKQKFKIYVRN